MCLMNAYYQENGQKTLVMSNVQRVENRDDGIVLYDLMERTKTVVGKLTHMDMAENFLIIEGSHHE